MSVLLLVLLGGITAWNIGADHRQPTEGERMVKEFHHGNIRVTLKYQLESPIDEQPNWKLNFRLKEGVGCRVVLVQGRVSEDSDMVFLAAMDDEKDGDEEEMDLYPPKGPKGFEDLVVLIQDGRGNWETKTFPARCFSLK